MGSEVAVQLEAHQAQAVAGARQQSLVVGGGDLEEIVLVGEDPDGFRDEQVIPLPGLGAEVAEHRERALGLESDVGGQAVHHQEEDPGGEDRMPEAEGSRPVARRPLSCQAEGEQDAGCERDHQDKAGPVRYEERSGGRPVGEDGRPGQPAADRDRNSGPRPAHQQCPARPAAQAGARRDEGAETGWGVGG